MAQHRTKTEFLPEYMGSPSANTSKSIIYKRLTQIEAVNLDDQTTDLNI